MRLSATSLMFFYVCLNLACFLTAEMQILPMIQEPHTPPSQMPFTTSLNSILSDPLQMTAGLTLGVTGIIGVILGHSLVGVVILVVAALAWLLPVVRWIVLGFPELMGMLGVPSPIYVVITALCSFVWFLFIIEFLGGRRVE